MVTMTVHDCFTDESRPGAVRSRFCFAAAGSRRAGVLYVNASRTDRGTMADAQDAARIAAKRAGCDTVELCNVMAPDR